MPFSGSFSNSGGGASSIAGIQGLAAALNKSRPRRTLLPLELSPAVMAIPPTMAWSGPDGASPINSGSPTALAFNSPKVTFHGMSQVFSYGRSSASSWANGCNAIRGNSAWCMEFDFESSVGSFSVVLNDNETTFMETAWLWVDDVPASTDPIHCTGVANSSAHMIRFTVTGLTAGMHRIRIYFHNAMYQGLEVNPADTVAPTAPQAFNVAVIGDSYVEANWAAGHFSGAVWGFACTGMTTAPAVGDTYTNSTITFTVTAVNITGSGSTKAGEIFGWGIGAPASSGNLTRTAGAGDATIAYTGAGNPNFMGQNGFAVTMARLLGATMPYLQGQSGTGYTNAGGSNRAVFGDPLRVGAQLLTIGSASAGTFTLTAAATTVTLNYNDTAATIRRRSEQSPVAHLRQLRTIPRLGQSIAGSTSLRPFHSQ